MVKNTRRFNCRRHPGLLKVPNDYFTRFTSFFRHALDCTLLAEPYKYSRGTRKIRLCRNPVESMSRMREQQIQCQA